jgi:hypothetical protein
MTTRPPQRRVPVRVHTGSGWLSGTLHLPKMQGFLEYLSSDEPSLALTEVSLPGQLSPIPFFALRRAAAHLVVPACAEWLVGAGPAPGALEPAREASMQRMVCCLLGLGTVTGRLEMVRTLRVSDFVAGHTGFLVLRHAVLGPDHEAAPLVFVNARACVGVGDLGPRALRPGVDDGEEEVVELTEAPPGPGMPA